MSAATDRMVAEVTRATSIEASAHTLIDQQVQQLRDLATQVADAVTTAGNLQAAADAAETLINQEADALAAADDDLTTALPANT